MKYETIKPERKHMQALAAQLAMNAVEGDGVSCSWCAREVEIVPSSFLDPGGQLAMIAEIVTLMEHCAFDHTGRASVIKSTRTLYVEWVRS